MLRISWIAKHTSERVRRKALVNGNTTRPKLIKKQKLRLRGHIAGQREKPVTTVIEGRVGSWDDLGRPKMTLDFRHSMRNRIAAWESDETDNGQCPTENDLRWRA